MYRSLSRSRSSRPVVRRSDSAPCPAASRARCVGSFAHAPVSFDSLKWRRNVCKDQCWSTYPQCSDSRSRSRMNDELAVARKTCSWCLQSSVDLVVVAAVSVVAAVVAVAVPLTAVAARTRAARQRRDGITFFY